MRLIFLTFLFVLMFLSEPISQPIHTMTKNIERTISWSADQELKVLSEKATVNVVQGASDKITLKIYFSASHSDSLIALKELDYMRYSLGLEENATVIRNGYILPKEVDRIQAKLRVTIDVEVPSGIKITLGHKYGNLNLHNLNGFISARIEYGDLKIEGLQGEADLYLLYSELRSQNINTSQFKCKGIQSKLWLELFDGNFNITGNYSDCSIKFGNVQSLTVNSTNSYINLRPKILDQYNYNLVSELGTISTLKQFSEDVIAYSDLYRLTLRFDKKNPTLKIKTSYNNIYLETN